MFKKSVFAGMYLETPMHAGCGSVTGAVDLPIQRERITEWPTVQASGLKGAFRDAYEKADGQYALAIFGRDNTDERESEDKAGAGSFADARILLFPVRASLAPYVWVTCPAVIRRLLRDMELYGCRKEIKEEIMKIKNNLPAPGESEFICLKAHCNEMVFEDLFLKKAENEKNSKEVLEIFRKLLPQDNLYYTKELERYLHIVSDRNFNLLVKTATEIHARIQLDDGKIAKNLWYQELLPSNTVFYTVIAFMDERGPAADGSADGSSMKTADELYQSLRGRIQDYIQIGGDETLGRGWTRLTWLEI